MDGEVPRDQEPAAVVPGRGRPTGTMQRLFPYLAVTTAGIVAAGILAGMHVTREYGTPKATVAALVETLKSADLARLTTAKPLHFAERVDAEVVARGEAEYQRILAIYEKQRRLGSEEYARRKTRYFEIMAAGAGGGDVAFLEQNARIVEASDPEPYYWTLGWDLLSEKQQRELGAKTYDQFVAEREQFVPREGRRLYAAFLAETFSGCDFKIERTTYHGQFARGLLRTWWAEVKLDWAESSEGDVVRFHGEERKIEPTDKVPAGYLRPGWADNNLTWDQARGAPALAPGVEIGNAACSGYLGRDFVLRYERGQWQIVWAGPLPAFDPDPDPGRDETDGQGIAATAGIVPTEPAGFNACRELATRVCGTFGTDSGPCRDATRTGDGASDEDQPGCAQMLANYDELFGAGGGA